MLNLITIFGTETTINICTVAIIIGFPIMLFGIFETVFDSFLVFTNEVSVKKLGVNVAMTSGGALLVYIFGGMLMNIASELIQIGISAGLF